MKATPRSDAAVLSHDELDELNQLHIAYEITAEYGSDVEDDATATARHAAELSAAVGRLLIAHGRGGCPTPNEHWKNHS